MLRRHFLAAAAPLAALPALAQARPKVVATFSILGDLVGEVGGDRIELAVLVGADTDAHTYQPKPTDARALAAAQALVSNGLGFEGWIDRLAKAAPFKGRAIVATAGVATLQGAPTPGHSHAQVPIRIAGRMSAACGAMSATSPRASPRPMRRTPPSIASAAQAYDKRLAELDQWIKAEIAKVPAAQRRAITAHDSFRYFTAAYGVQFFAPRGFTTESEPSARDVATLIRQVREQKIKALFVENMSNPGLVDQIARESGAVVGPRLYSDALSRPNGPAPTYEAMMRHNVTALVAGMMKN